MRKKKLEIRVLFLEGLETVLKNLLKHDKIEKRKSILKQNGFGVLETAVSCVTFLYIITAVLFTKHHLKCSSYRMLLMWNSHCPWQLKTSGTM